MVRPISDLQRTVAPFKVESDFSPSGDQPTAIAELEQRVHTGEQDMVLLGATGTGKTATVAWLAERLQRPVLVMQPNKTLAAQFANELRQFFPRNAVEYFVSYYDYYQPEAYVPQTDTYIEKDSSLNEEVERLRHSATNSLLTRRDVIVVATVSAIYGLGTPQEYVSRMVKLRVGQEVERDALLRRLVGIQYARNDLSGSRGTFRVRGDTLERPGPPGLAGATGVDRALARHHEGQVDGGPSRHDAPPGRPAPEPDRTAGHPTQPCPHREPHAALSDSGPEQRHRYADEAEPDQHRIAVDRHGVHVADLDAKARCERVAVVDRAIEGGQPPEPEPAPHGAVRPPVPPVAEASVPVDPHHQVVVRARSPEPVRVGGDVVEAAHPWVAQDAVEPPVAIEEEHTVVDGHTQPVGRARNAAASAKATSRIRVVGAMQRVRKRRHGQLLPAVRGEHPKPARGDLEPGGAYDRRDRDALAHRRPTRDQPALQ